MNRKVARSFATFTSLSGVGAIALVDWWAGDRFGFSIFYAVPVLFATWQAGRNVGLSVAVLAAGAWTLAKYYAAGYSADPTAQLWAGFVRLGFFVLLVVYQAFLDTERRHARTDVLTKLLNRRGFLERMEIELERARRSGHAFTLAYLDCDHFKTVNDRGGHRQGNAVLARIGKVLRTQLRRMDVSGRLGGDEFSIIMPDTEAQQADMALRRLRSELHTGTKDIGWPMTFSIGAVVFEAAPESPEAALHAADALMYQVKRGGRNSLRVEVHSASPGR